MSTYVYDDPAIPASQASEQWDALNHQTGDNVIHDLPELTERFRQDVRDSLPIRDNGESAPVSSAVEDIKRNGRLLALWSCIFGYCEALTTNKATERRYSPYPIPVDALQRMVSDEFFYPSPDSPPASAIGRQAQITPRGNQTGRPLCLVQRGIQKKCEG